MSELISLYEGPEVPVLRRKEDEERGGGAAPWLFRTASARPVTLGAGAFGGPGRAALGPLAWLRALLGGSLSGPEAAALAATGLATLGLMAWVGLSAFGSRGETGGRGAFAFGAADARGEGLTAAGGLPDAGPRPEVGDLLKGGLAEAVPEPAEPAKPAVSDAPVPAPAEAPHPVEPAGVVSEGAPARPARGLWAMPPLASAGGRVQGEALRDGLAPFAGVKTFAPPPGGPALGRADALSAARRPAAARGFGASRVQARRAMGQLRFARRESDAARNFASGETARQFSANAFDQARTLGGMAPVAGPGLSEGTVGPLGAGAPDLTQPAVGAGENKTPYQDKVNDAKKNTDMAKLLTLIGLAMMAAGAAALAASKSAALQPQVAKMLALLGKALLAGGLAAIVAGLMMSKQAKEDGRQVGRDSGQTQQGAVLEDCAGQAVLPKDCSPKPTAIPVSSVHEAVREESGAGYEVQNGGPVGR